MAEDINFKFNMKIYYNVEKYKLGTKETWSRSCIWDPFHISGTTEATNFKFDVQIDYKEYYRKCKIKVIRGWRR